MSTSCEVKPGDNLMEKFIVPLLALLIFINYVDRGSLNITAPLIKDQLHFSTTEIGILISSFFWTYVPAQVLTGWLSSRISPYRIIAAGLTLWAIATAGLGLANGFLSFLLLRLLLGLGESVAFPCSSKLFAQHVAQDRLGHANGLIAVGMALGPGFGALAGGLLMAQQGWRSVYLLFGLASLLWLVPWTWASRRAEARAGRLTSLATPSLGQLLQCRALWGATIGHVCANYAFYFIIAWLPLYLVKERALSIEHMAQLAGLIYVSYAASAYSTGLLTDRLIRSGMSINRVRKGFMNASLLGIALCLILVATGSAAISLLGLGLLGLAMGMGSPNIYAISQTLAGPAAAGKWIGIQNSLANIAGMVAPVITGYIVDHTGHFSGAFLVAALMSLTGIVAYGGIVRKVDALRWVEQN